MYLCLNIPTYIGKALNPNPHTTSIDWMWVKELRDEVAKLYNKILIGEITPNELKEALEAKINDFSGKKLKRIIREVNYDNTNSIFISIFSSINSFNTASDDRKEEKLQQITQKTTRLVDQFDKVLEENVEIDGNTESMPQIFSKKGFNPSKFYISDMIQNKSDNEKDDDNSLPILKKVTDINQKIKESYMNTIKGNTDILNFYSEVQPLITEIVLDDKINEEIGEEEISSLNDLLINLNTKVSSMKKEDNIGHITQANIFRNQAMDVATKMVRKFNIINHIVKA